MDSQQNVKALVIEGDPGISGAVEALLKERSYDVVIFSDKKEALNFLKQEPSPLAVVGDAEKMTSPMTSMILITDLPKKEVDEKAEGYGILGHINRKIPPKDLTSLLENFENILKSYDRTAI
ncbi:MAG: hypothetical protein JRJ11_13845 [Deltaproteobacteria bacterium]|nr:hypothetical protein [Deltaproteobacteria bacterium]